SNWLNSNGTKTLFCFKQHDPYWYLFTLVFNFKGLSEAQANCSTVTCYNGGTCNNYTASPPCLCPLPYIAPYCSAAADYCFTLQPDKGISELPVCLNGGNCTLTYTDPYFNCSCPNGYTAPSQAANCSTVTCYNGGTCNNFTDSPPCLCPLPYIAPYCESAADYCFTLQPDKGITELPVCLNDGNCTLTYTDPYFNCTCPPEYTGNCCNETSIDISTDIDCYSWDISTDIDCYSWDISTDIDCYSWDISTDIDCYSWDISTDIDCYSWDIAPTSTATAGTHRLLHIKYRHRL
uniref:EGF-like domain-containing protein n=1 Tax=Macrostomum lignano TaxID=282301 RepID=A0A1I8GV97_9PLAT